MSKTVKNWMIRDYRERLAGISDAVVISIRGIPANENNELRVDLKKKDIRVSVVRNSLARHAVKDTPLETLDPLFTGPTALAYGAESVVDIARALVDWAKKLEHLELRGAVLDGELYEGAAAIDRLSKMPTRPEALAQAIALILSPAKTLMGQVGEPGGRILGIIKTIQEKLEKGESIARAC